jgi:hypothetical protein
MENFLNNLTDRKNILSRDSHYHLPFMLKLKKPQSADMLCRILVLSTVSCTPFYVTLGMENPDK